MDLESNYEIIRTASIIRCNNFSRVALQFPDELLEDSTRVAKALRGELGRGVSLFVMADTAYGSCCVEEVGAAHVDAECVVHYGHACMSPTTTIPAFFVFGKASIDVNHCVQSLHRCLSTNDKPVLVLFGLEYAHALHDIKAAMPMSLPPAGYSMMIQYAEVTASIINPAGDSDSRNGHGGNVVVLNHADKYKASMSDNCSKLSSGTGYGLGGLKWCLPMGNKMEDYLLFWIGSENSAFANIVLTFNSCEIVRYDANRCQLLKDFSHQKRILKRRYYLVEKAKDANVVGILVGTLGVAGYRRVVNEMKELIGGAGKKTYTLVMGRPNSAKLANFPECDVFVHVSCAQTALLDSKDFLAPLITPFEAVLAFSRGKEWTGEYVMDFNDLFSSVEDVKHIEDARFSFIKGGYMEDVQPYENEDRRNEGSLSLAETVKALKCSSQPSDSILFQGSAASGTDFFVARSFQGLNMQFENPSPSSYVIGKSGRAAGYNHEKRQEKLSSLCTH